MTKTGKKSWKIKLELSFSLIFQDYNDTSKKRWAKGCFFSNAKMTQPRFMGGQLAVLFLDNYFVNFCALATDIDAGGQIDYFDTL